jgi:DNA-binding NtrC family response regulator
LLRANPQSIQNIRIAPFQAVKDLGEASGIIQAKLLAYLDDYAVRPRGWTGEPFFCPTLVVGATNRDIRNSKRFRKDLLARFTDIDHVPPLRERQESFPFILDCLLQQSAINPRCGVKEIGDQAFEALKQHKFPGNFRELENLLRTVCETVVKDGRNYITRKDLPF